MMPMMQDDDLMHRQIKTQKISASRQGDCQDDRVDKFRYARFAEVQPVERQKAEAFITQCYQQTWGAIPPAFMPRLFALTSEDGQLLGCVGVRHANQPFFLEHYLDQPVEQFVAREQRIPVARYQIVEVGQFAGSVPGSSRALITHLTMALQREGWQWVVFTGTRLLCNAFNRIGLEPGRLASARIQCLPEALRHCWGHYYDDQPAVFYGRISAGYQHLYRGEIG